MLGQPTRQFTAYFTLFFIVIGAFCLRIWGIDFGLPELLHLDEPFEMNRALRLAAGSFDWRRAGKGGLYFILFGEMGGTFVFLYLKGVVAGPADFAAWFVKNEHLFYLAGRYTCAILSTASVLLIYLIGVRLKDRMTGLIAAFLLAICPLAATNAHFSTVDNPLVFFLLCSWLYLLKAAETDGRQSWLMTGLFAGLAVITKLPAVVMVLPIGLGLLFRDDTYKQRGKLAFMVFVVFFVVVLVGEPGYFLGFTERIRRILELFLPQFYSVVAESSSQIDNSLVDQKNISPTVFYLKNLTTHAGLPVLLLSIPAWIILLYRRNRSAVLIGSFLFPFVVLICLTKTNLVYTRYLLPVLPLFFLLFAAGASEVGGLFGLNNKRETSVSLVIVLIAGSFLVPATWAAVNKFSLPNTRILAQQWIQKNLLEGAAIFMEGGQEHRSQYKVPLYNKIENISAMIDGLQESDPGKAKYWTLKKKVLSDLDIPRYDLKMVMHNEVWPTLATLKAERINYFIIDKIQFNCIPTDGLGDAPKSRIDFYCKLQGDKSVSRIKSFPATEKSWGSSLEIYHITTLLASSKMK